MHEIAFINFFQLIGAAFGAAGQRCMALTTAIFVGESQEWIPDLVAKAKELQVNEGTVSCYDIIIILWWKIIPFLPNFVHLTLHNVHIAQCMK